MKFLYIISALAATAMAAPEMFEKRDADLTCNYKCLAPVKGAGHACACSSQEAPCFIYACQGGTRAIGGVNAEVFRQY